MPSDAVDEDDAVAKTISQVVCGVQDSDTHSTAGSTGQSGSYNSVSPTDLTASSRTLIAQLPKKHHASHDARHGHTAAWVAEHRRTWHRKHLEGPSTAASALAGSIMCKRRSWKPESSRMGLATSEPLDQAGLGSWSFIMVVDIISPGRAANQGGRQRRKTGETPLAWPVAAPPRFACCRGGLEAGRHGQVVDCAVCCLLQAMKTRPVYPNRLFRGPGRGHVLRLLGFGNDNALSEWRWSTTREKRVLGSPWG